jgi:hypothetical protein
LKRETKEFLEVYNVIEGHQQALTIISAPEIAKMNPEAMQPKKTVVRFFSFTSRFRKPAPKNKPMPTHISTVERCCSHIGSFKKHSRDPLKNPGGIDLNIDPP